VFQYPQVKPSLGPRRPQLCGESDPSWKDPMPGFIRARNLTGCRVLIHGRASAVCWSRDRVSIPEVLSGRENIFLNGVRSFAWGRGPEIAQNSTRSSTSPRCVRSHRHAL